VTISYKESRYMCNFSTRCN